MEAGVKATGPGRNRDGSYGSGIDHYGTRTGMGLTSAGTGWDREQCTSPMQISSMNRQCYEKSCNPIYAASSYTPVYSETESHTLKDT